MKLFITAAACIINVAAFSQDAQPKNYYQIPITPKKITVNVLEFAGPQHQLNLTVNTTITILPLDNMRCLIPATNKIAQMPVKNYSGVNSILNAFGTK